MAKGIIGKKIGMTQIFSENGAVIPVTVVQAGPCVVVQKKTVESDGYNAIQIGFEEILSEKKVNKPMAFVKYALMLLMNITLVKQSTAKFSQKVI